MNDRPQGTQGTLGRLLTQQVDAIERERRLQRSLATSNARARNLGAALADSEAARAELALAGLTVREKLTYGPESPHSWFLDLYRVERSGQQGAAWERLQAHGREMDRTAPQRAQARARKARAEAEVALTGTSLERRAIDAFTGAGGVVFERRALVRVDGEGGYTVPPAWLIDRTVPAARADAALAAAVTTLPLPGYVDSVNIPVVRTGTAAGVQTGDTIAAVSRDPADAFVSSRVITVAGSADIAATWLDRNSATGAAIDSLIWSDLEADAQLTLDGLLMLGSGVNGQTLGLLPPQTAPGTSLAVYAPNSNTASGQQLYYASSGTTLAATIAQAVSGVTRARGKRPTCLLTAPWWFDSVTAMTDQQGRPYVEPKGPHPVSPAADVPPGVLGHIGALPVLGDLNVPTTMGSAYPNAPYLGAVNGAQLAGQPGTGSYTPVIPLVADDVLVFLGEPKMRVLTEVLSGNLAVRFQLYQYAAVIVNRWQAVTSGTLPNGGGWAAGACSSYGVVTQQGSNSLLSASALGYAA